LAVTAFPATARGRHQSSRLGSSTGPARARAFEHDRFERGGSPSWRLAATALPATARGRHQSSRLGSSTGPARARGFEHARFERSGSPVLAFGVKSSVAPGLTVRANPGPRRIHTAVAGSPAGLCMAAGGNAAPARTRLSGVPAHGFPGSHGPSNRGSVDAKCERKVNATALDLTGASNLPCAAVAGRLPHQAGRTPR
jgi:hypothetical protein